MAASSTCTLAAAGAIRTHNPVGETVQFMEYTRANNGGAALTKDVATTFMMTRVPAWSLITGVDISVRGGLGNGGTYDVLIGGSTCLTTASITAVGIKRITTHDAITCTASATATLWRYLNCIVTPGTTSSSIVISAVIRYLSDDPYEGPGRGVAGSG